MRRPGDRLRALASHVCDDTTMAWIVEPAITDLQIEHREAVRNGRAWLGRWIRLTGYVAVLKTLALVCAREARAGIAITIAAIALLELPLLSATSWSGASPARLALYLVPASIPLAAPIGLTLGILWRRGGKGPSRQLALTTLVIACACSALSFGALGWLAPVSNQAFRVAASGRPDLAAGLNELTLGELRDRVTVTMRETPEAARSVAVRYYGRWAFACAPLALAGLALSVLRWRRRASLTLGVLCCACYTVYVSTTYATGIDTAWPPVVVAWLPNIMLAAISACRVGACLR